MVRKAMALALGTLTLAAVFIQSRAGSAPSSEWEVVAETALGCETLLPFEDIVAGTPVYDGVYAEVSLYLPPPADEPTPTSEEAIPQRVRLSVASFEPGGCLKMALYQGQSVLYVDHGQLTFRRGLDPINPGRAFLFADRTVTELVDGAGVPLNCASAALGELGCELPVDLNVTLVPGDALLLHDATFMLRNDSASLSAGALISAYKSDESPCGNGSSCPSYPP